MGSRQFWKWAFMNRFFLVIRLSKPIFLLGGVLLYAMGVGIARYLGTTIRWDIYILGQTWVSLLQLGAHYLNEYFKTSEDADSSNRTTQSGSNEPIKTEKIERSTLLILSAACLACVASLTVLLIQNINLGSTEIFIMTLAFLGAFFYAAPPLKLATTGYGELTVSILTTILLPIFAYHLQTGELHRLLTMTTFPLTALLLSMMLSFELPGYANDLKTNKQTLMVRIGWKRGMFLHNLLILSAFLLYGVAMVFGLPLSIGLPVFLVLPLGVLQIWQMHRIAEGAKPNWRSLTLTAVVLFGAAAYLLTFSFWTR